MIGGSAVVRSSSLTPRAHARARVGANYCGLQVYSEPPAPTRMGIALTIAGELQQARTDLARYDRDTAARRVDRDADRRTELVDRITELQATLDRMCRFYR